MAKQYILIGFLAFSLVLTALGVYNIIRYRNFLAMSSDKARAVKFLVSAVSWFILAVTFIVIGFKLYK